MLSRQKVKAVLDTSFWIHSFRSGLFAYLFDYLDVYVPEAVAREAMPTIPSLPTVVLPNVQLFRLLVRVNLIHVKKLVDVPPLAFHVGETEAIALAQQREYVLLIDDYEPFMYATQHGIQTLCLADFVVQLNHDKVITLQMARKHLEALKNELRDSLVTRSLAHLIQV
jgi:hypothetical protein